MKIKTTDETMVAVNEYAEKLIGLQLQKKDIDIEIKELKAEFKEEGIAVSLVTKIITKMKNDLKKTSGEIMEEEILTEKLNANQSIVDMVSSLNS